MKSSLQVTYCSAKKNPLDVPLPPRKRYIGNRIKNFFDFCLKNNLPWAILSGKYGLVFPDDRIPNYNVTFRFSNNSDGNILVVVENVEMSREDSLEFIHNWMKNVRKKLKSRDVRRVNFFIYEDPSTLPYLQLFLKAASDLARVNVFKLKHRDFSDIFSLGTKVLEIEHPR